VSLSYPAGIVTDYNSLPADCLNDSDEALYRLRVLALDTITIKSFSCIEYDDEQACVEVSGQTSDVNQGEVEQGAPVVSSFGPFVFPVQASKQAIKSAGWCWQKQDVTCHGTESYGYYASDIFINEGVPIVSATNGTVVKVEQNQPNKNGSAEQTVITIKGDDCDDSGNNLTCLGEGTVFWYGHMKPGSATVSVGDRVTAGQQIALSGGIPQADGTPAHLHFDATNRKNSFRGSCARENVQACKELGFINIQPNLHSAFNAIGTTNNTAQSPNNTALFGSYFMLNKILGATNPIRNIYVTA
jgi:murein DD-endopeptidase MepM/ murein hydrolase activator NlpD